MYVLMVVCNPNRESFSHVIAEECGTAVRQRGHTVIQLDLYKEHADFGFNPILQLEEIKRRFSFDESIQRYSREVARADAYIFIHPDWWGMPPALLVGWIDRVFRPGIVYDYMGEEYLPKKKIPLLAGRRAIVLCTTDERQAELLTARTTEAPNSMQDDRGGVTHPLETMWRHSVLGYCGVSDVLVRIFWNVHDSTLHERRQWLKQVREETTDFLAEEDL